jgi:hypothetical protein
MRLFPLEDPGAAPTKGAPWVLLRRFLKTKKAAGFRSRPAPLEATQSAALRGTIFYRRGFFLSAHFSRLTVGAAVFRQWSAGSFFSFAHFSRLTRGATRRAARDLRPLRSGAIGSKRAGASRKQERNHGNSEFRFHLTLSMFWDSRMPGENQKQPPSNKLTP